MDGAKECCKDHAMQQISRKGLIEVETEKRHRGVRDRAREQAVVVVTF